MTCLVKALGKRIVFVPKLWVYLVSQLKSLFSAKVELELASFLSGKRDIERRQDNLDRVNMEQMRDVFNSLFSSVLLYNYMYFIYDTDKKKYAKLLFHGRISRYELALLCSTNLMKMAVRNRKWQFEISCP